MRGVIALAVCLLCGWAGAGEKLVPSALFSDNMVLQREIAVPVWGEAKPGSDVTVTFAGQTKTAKADDKGAWKLSLEPLKTDKKPAEMVIMSGSDTVTIKNVLVGEVWICSGQSNMQCPMSDFKGAPGKECKPIVDAITAADFPAIRHFLVKQTVSPEKKLTTLSGAWVVCTPKTVNGFTATGFFFARALYNKLGIPVGLVANAWGGVPIRSYMSREAMQTSKWGKETIEAQEKRQAAFNEEKAAADLKVATEKWEADKKAAEAAGRPAPFKPVKAKEPFSTPHYPSTLYNALLYPLAPYAIRGAIWYQGESDSGQKVYAEAFSTMIKDWRTLWGQGDFPFYFVQLANFQAVAEQPGDSGYAIVRDAQFKTLAVPNTGMAVIMDVGEEKDIHPKNKITVGERLALWALAKDYKQNVKVYSGPLFKSAEFKDGKAVIKFDHAGSGLVAGKRVDVWTEPALNSDAPERFQICGADKKWVWATAKVAGSDTVEVSAESVKTPVAVRYLWMQNPGSVNLLYNKEGLPASPFKTDDY